MSVKFGIGIATYQRPDGSTPEKLRRCLQSIKSQAYKNFTVYLIGDHYGSDMSLWGDIYDAECELPWLKYHNLPFAAERENNVSGRALWHSGGCFAINFALAWMRCDKADVYAHMDDDDWWEPDHLDLLAKAYEDPDVAVAYTHAEYVRKIILPQVVTPDQFPQPYRTVHSSLSWRLSMVPLNYEPQMQVPTDAHTIARVSELCTTLGYKSACIPDLTVHHTEENRN